MAKSAVCLKVGAEMAGDSNLRVCSGFLHSVSGLWSHDQKILSQASWSKADASEVDSAARVLVTTLCIFLQPQEIGLIGHCLFSLMSLWVPTMITPECESGFLLDENEASLNAMDLKSFVGIGLMTMATSWWCLASCNKRLPSSNVSTVALLMADCKNESLLARSGLVFVDVYWRLPMSPRSASFSLSVTVLLICVFRLTSIAMGLIFLTYADWLKWILLSPCWVTSMPVKVKACVLWEPKGNFFSRSLILSW